MQSERPQRPPGQGLNFLLLGIHATEQYSHAREKAHESASRKAYQENLGKSSIGYHTIFASTTGEHMAPVEADKPASNFGAWTGRFLACHLGGSPTAKVCDRLYGDGADNICNDPNLSPIAYDKKENALLPTCERQ